MEFEAVFTLIVVGVSLLLFVLDRYPVDMVTLGTVVALLLGGILTPEEAVQGFSNPATITVAGMLILSAAISRSGALTFLARRLATAARHGDAINLALPLMLGVAAVSAFINNTAVVAIFLPLTVDLARRTGVSPSRLLLPLSYAALFGGTCTLLGTSTNVLVDFLSRQNGMEPFSVFEFLPLGLIMTITGILYMVLFGIPRLPDNGPSDLWRDYNVADYLCGLESGEMCLVEAAVAPSSGPCGKSLNDLDLKDRFGCTVVAVRHLSKVRTSGFNSVPLRGGDVLLLQVPPARLPGIRNEFILLSQTEPPANQRFRKVGSLAAMAITVGLAALEVLPIVSAVLLGCLLVFATRCLDPAEAYRTVEWQVIMLLGGMLALGEALEKTGITGMVATQVVTLGDVWGPVALVSGLYLLTSLLTEILSNNATSVLLVPVAIEAAAGLGVDPKPLVMAICFAASASFMTPIGYQTNTMVFGPGRYRFVDYLRVGTPLNILFWLIASFTIPYFWPL